MAPLSMPLAESKFSLNSAAVAGFFGGKEAISAMATVNLYKGRRWLGWFNSPGSYTVAKRFGRMANSRFWDGLFPGPNDSPAVSFGLDGRAGPEYIAPLSGTEMRTQHLGYLTMERCKGITPEEIQGRETQHHYVSYLVMKDIDHTAHVEPRPIDDALFGLIPIATSVLTCIMCALVYDWYGFSMISLGILSSGLASLVIGKGSLVIKTGKSADSSPPGHGILKEGCEVVVIKGEEPDVNIITKGRFELEIRAAQTDKEKGPAAQIDKERGPATQIDKEKGPATQIDEEKGLATQIDEEKGLATQTDKEKEKGPRKEEDPERKYHDIGICSLFLLLQFLLQLLLIPQAPLFGQIMFVISLGVSWAYNSYLSSLEKEKIQAQLLFQTLGNPEMLRFRAGTRTTMAVFACLLVFHKVEGSSQQESRKQRLKILRSCIGNDTVVWDLWTEKVIKQLLEIHDESEELPFLQEDGEDRRGLTKNDQDLLTILLEDATAAFRHYFKVRGKLPDHSSRPSSTGK